MQNVYDDKSLLISFYHYQLIFSKAVPDFIDFHVGNFHWFIFNVSDIFITLGVISMIVIELTNNKNENK